MMDLYAYFLMKYAARNSLAEALQEYESKVSPFREQLESLDEQLKKLEQRRSQLKNQLEDIQKEYRPYLFRQKYIEPIRQAFKTHPIATSLAVSSPFLIGGAYGLSRLLRRGRYEMGRRSGLTAGIALGVLGILGFNILSDLLSKARYRIGSWLIGGGGSPYSNIYLNPYLK